jgi:hypothetical protein
MTDTEPTTAQLLHHRGTCSRPASVTWPIPGAVRTSCPECGKYVIAWVSDLRTPEVIDPPPVAPPVAPPVSAYRCREHLGEPVNWRGKGCTRCPKGKPKTRKAKRSSDNYTERY